MELSDPELDRILTDIRHRFDWGDPSTRFVRIAAWRSRSARLYRFGSEPPGTDVVLKVGRDWGPADAEALNQGMRALGEVFERQNTSRTRVPSALGWHDDPAAICMRFVDGVDAILLFADHAHPGWEGSRWTPDTLASECGRALGVYHSQPTAPSGPDGGDLKVAARAMRVPRRALARAAGAAVVAPSFGDFGPHQFVASVAGDLWLIDPPPAPGSGSVQGDMARFLFGLDRALGRDRTASDADRESLRDAFLAGYADTGRVDPRSPESRFLIAVYQGAMARGVARQRWRGGERRKAVRHGAQWARTLLSLRRGPRT